MLIKSCFIIFGTSLVKPFYLGLEKLLADKKQVYASLVFFEDQSKYKML